MNKLIFSLISSVMIAFAGAAAFAENPQTIVVSFQKQKEPDQLKKSADLVAAYLTKKLGQPVEVLVPTSYGTTAQGLISGKVHVAYMDSLPYILASQETELEILAVEKRNNKTDYNSLVLVAKDSPIKSLKDLKQKSFAFTSQTSTSGYLFPLAQLTREKLVNSTKDVDQYFSKVTYAGGYDKALAAVASGQADAAALSDYAFEGPKADLYGDVATREKLRVLARISGVPTHLVVASKKLSPEIRKKVQSALISLGKEDPTLLASVYGAAELIVPKKNHVQGTQDALKLTGLTPQTFVK
jgi:phosphonate transport system substrate-binding protein